MQRHDTETKAQAFAMHTSGESNRAIARKLAVPESTIRHWLDQAAQPEVAQKTKAWLDEQVWGLIADTITSIRAVARQAQDTEWLRAQNANDLAVYTGVQTDKLIRVLGALELRDDEAVEPTVTLSPGEDAQQTLAGAGTHPPA